MPGFLHRRCAVALVTGFPRSSNSPIKKKGSPKTALLKLAIWEKMLLFLLGVREVAPQYLTGFFIYRPQCIVDVPEA